MLCPECRIEMLVLEHDNIEIDFCDECGGIWLDEGELELLAGEDGQPSPMAAALASNANIKGKGARPCPVCSKKMLLADVDLGATTPPENRIVEIDKCPRGHGMWFDKGELGQIISASGGGEAVIDFLGSLFGNE